MVRCDEFCIEERFRLLLIVLFFIIKSDEFVINNDEYSVQNDDF